jgi:hypothetical protein
MTANYEKVVQLAQADAALSPSTLLPAALSARYFVSCWRYKICARSIFAAASTGVE